MGIPKKGEIWAVNLDPAVGHEQQKARPCLVLSETAFNQLGLMAVAPITSGGVGPYAGFTTSIEKSMGMKTYGHVLAHQTRMIDFTARERVATFIEQADSSLLEDVLAKYQAILGINS